MMQHTFISNNLVWKKTTKLFVKWHCWNIEWTVEPWPHSNFVQPIFCTICFLISFCKRDHVRIRKITYHCTICLELLRPEQFFLVWTLQITPLRFTSLWGYNFFCDENWHCHFTNGRFFVDARLGARSVESQRTSKAETCDIKATWFFVCFFLQVQGFRGSGSRVSKICACQNQRNIRLTLEKRKLTYIKL